MAQLAHAGCALVVITIGMVALLLQGCVKARHCSDETSNCMETGCCLKPGLKCYARDREWATCQESCTHSYTSSCDIILPGGHIKRHPTTTRTTVTTTIPLVYESDFEWFTGTWTSGYWDCCKPSCSWPGKGHTDNPVTSCDARTGHKLKDANEGNICDQKKPGHAVTCSDNQPFVVGRNLSMGFAAAAVGGKLTKLRGDENCGQCFELLFTDRQHLDKNTGSLWGGSSPSLTGRRMILQVTNIGYDVKGNHSFDIQIPGAGQGIFAKGCATQYPDQTVDDFDCGKRHGGCSDKGGCARLPAELQKGCEWHFEWFEWLKSGGRSNNPFVKFRRVQCPMKLVAISGATPTDDTDFPIASESPDFYYI